MHLHDMNLKKRLTSCKYTLQHGTHPDSKEVFKMLFVTIAFKRVIVVPWEMVVSVSRTHIKQTPVDLTPVGQPASLC
jgi:hypothetical protein